MFGANYPWYNYGTDFGENAWGSSGVSAKYGEIEADFEKISEMGIRVVRWFVFADGRAAPEFSTDGSVTGLDDKVFDDLDAALGIAQSHNIHLDLVLLDFHWLAQPKDEKGVILGGHSDVIEDSAKRESFFQNVLIPLLQRYGKNPYILSWEVINEPEWAIDDPSTKPISDLKPVSLDTMQSFVSETVNLIHQNTGQSVTVGSASRNWWKLWEHMGLDICQFHYYDSLEKDSPIDFPYTKMATNLPCIFGEFPTAKTSHTSDNYYQTIVNNGYAGAFPWSLRAGDEFSDVISNTATIQTWANRLANYIEIPLPTDWVPPTPLPTRTPLPTPTITPNPTLIAQDTSQYGFEIRDNEWAHQTYENSQAVTNVHRVYSPAPVYAGQYALQWDVNLIAGDAHLSAGEAYIDMLQQPPRDESVGPYNLQGHPITCWVFVPTETQREVGIPWIGFQVFVKDMSYKSEYGTWVSIASNQMGKWLRISMTPQSSVPRYGYMDEGFDPTQIMILGAKIGTAGKAPAGTSYTGPIYIDACTWK